MKKIIVTGSTSMIGIATIESALSHGTEVYALVREGTTRQGRLPKSSLLHVMSGNLDSLADVKGLPDDADVFYHFAWAGTSKSDRDDPVIQEYNIRYTLDAVELAKKCGCKKFIGAGSQAEYGPTEGKIDDDTKFKPITSYGSAKYAAYLLSKKLCEKYGMIHIWGRIFSVYGRYDNEDTMLNYAIDQFLMKQTAQFSAGTQSWNYLNEHDAGELFYLMGDYIEQTDAYRVASDRSMPLKDYILAVAETMGTVDLCEFSSESEQTSKPYGLNTCDERLFLAVAYRPKVSFQDGIKEMIEERKRKLEK